MKKTGFKRGESFGLKRTRTTWSRKAQPKGLKRKAWDIFSKWVRERDKMCVTCGSRGDLDAGHYWHNCLDFDPMNINAQCRKCNRFQGGNLAEYGAYLLNKYGEEKMKDLEKRHYLALRGEFYTDQQYLDIITHYKQELAKLEG